MKSRCYLLPLQWVFLFFSLFTLAGCASVVNRVTNLVIIQPTGTPTSALPAPTRLPSAPGATCLVKQDSALRIYQPQGNQLAWSSDSNLLAYIGIGQRGGWYTGSLNVVKMDNPDPVYTLAENAVGGLSWSPDGLSIGYIAFRQEDGLYSIDVVTPVSLETIISNKSHDLFPGKDARTDSWSSLKAILGWSSNTLMDVVVSCGSDCLQTIAIDIQTSSQSKAPATQRMSADIWKPFLNLKPSSVPDIPFLKDAAIISQNWSTDGTKVAYQMGKNKNNNLWIYDVKNELKYHLDVGQWHTVEESDWSPSGAYLAVKAEQGIYIFSFNCK